jgi:hypothetical protein
MANVDTPSGLRPIKHRNGASYNGAANPYFIPSTYSGGNMFIGDCVLVTGTSNTAVVEVPGAGKFGIGTLPEINIAAAGDGIRISGVIIGFAADPTALENQYRLDDTERVAIVCDDPDIVYEIQADSATILTATAVGASFNILLGTGSTTTGLSATELNGSDEGQDPQKQLILTRFVNREDNDATLVHAKCEVVISTHAMQPEGAETNDGILGT